MLRQPSQTDDLTVTAKHRRIRELCKLLADTALQLDTLRTPLMPADPSVASLPPKLEAFWGDASAGKDGEASSGTPSWYGAIEPYFEELERLIRMAPPLLCEAVLADPHIAGIAPRLHQVRAAYEYDKETTLAQAIAGSSAGRSHLTALIEREAFWAYSSELRAALRGCRRIAVAGSGPLPLTALSIAKELGVSVTAVECDETAYDLGRDIVAMGGYADHVRCVEARIEELDCLKVFDAIVAAVLVGVDMGNERRHHRGALAEQLVSALAPEARLVVREPHGLGRLFHPPLNVDSSDRVEAELLLPPRSPETPYRSGIAVLHRAGAATA